MSRLRAALAAFAGLRASGGGRAMVLLVVAVALASCGGSSQKGNAFVFLSVDGFSVNGGGITGAVNSSVAAGTTTTACVTLRNNLKAPTISAPTGLDNVVIQSYTVTLQGLAGPFTFGTSAFIPAGTVAAGVVSNNTATFTVILVPPSAKGVPVGTVTTAVVKFKGRDGRGNSVETEGGVTVVFVSASQSDSSCSGTPPSNGNGGGGGTTTTGTTT